jgi:hypothetical protein
LSDNATIHRETFWMLVDERLGGGMSRSVWSSKVLPDMVVKVEDAAEHFQNVVEWETWQRVKGTAYERWFAPCEAISPCGAVLLMARTKPAARYPDKMPAFLCDFKRTNYGVYKGRVVCHDYGTNMLFENGMTKRMWKANWS